MTADQVRGWLARRRPEPPPVLMARLAQLLGAFPPDRLGAARSMTEAMSMLGVASLESLDSREPDGPDVALDLLAADAFVTYAFEAAAEEDQPVESIAARLLERVAP
jgi:hypothetical protein